MENYVLSEETRRQFGRISTASLATALFKRSLRNQYIQGVGPVGSSFKPMVGQAFTLRYMPAREDRNGIEVFRDPAHKQRVAVENCPPGQVLVIDSRKDARAASAGGILVSRLMMRGCAGIVTDGGFRDAGTIAGLDIPAYHSRPSAPTNLTLHEAIAINEPIGCGDAPVFPGDVVVGDQDGVIVVPAHLADEIATECTQMEDYENFVEEEVLKGRSIIGLYPMTSPEIKAIFDNRQKQNTVSSESATNPGKG